MTYEQQQINRLDKNQEYFSIKLTDWSGNATNYIGITKEQLEQIEKILTEVDNEE